MHITVRELKAMLERHDENLPVKINGEKIVRVGKINPANDEKSYVTISSSIRRSTPIADSK